MISVAYSEAFVEVLAIIENPAYKDKQLIPSTFINFLKENASKTYKVSFDKSKQIKELNLKKETKGILSVIYYNYLCPNEQKEEYIKLLKENKIKFEDGQRQKYNPEKIFENSNSFNKIPTTPVLKEESLVEYKENIFKRIINKIKKFINLK